MTSSGARGDKLQPRLSSALSARLYKRRLYLPNYGALLDQLNKELVCKL